jgi:ABC-type amino acid transport system, permease component
MGWCGLDRHCAICRRLSGRSDPGRPAGDPRGQGEAASALGLSYWKTTGLIVMPQALRHVIPGLVNSFIALFKDTSLVSIVSLFDLLGQLRASFSDPVWATPTTLFTGFAFTGLIYFVFCFGMSRYSLFVEHRLNVHQRN